MCIYYKPYLEIIYLSIYLYIYLFIYTERSFIGFYMGFI